MTHRDLCVHSSTPDVRASGVVVRLGGDVVLDDVDVIARGGRVTALLGPNGSGKTTLLHVLAGLRTPERGTVVVGDVAIGSLSHRRRARTIALVEQHASTTTDLTVRQVVALGRLPHRRMLGGTRSDSGAEVVDKVMDLVGLTHLADRGWTTLSGGERQRAHLARTLAQQPQVLLLDEPTNHLDLGQQLRFLALARDLGLTIIAALHDLELATAFCDDVVVLDHGRVHGQGPVTSTLTASLLREVYHVEASLDPHPRLDRPHLIWDRHVKENP